MQSLETITNWALRRGFVFPSSEIYDGFAAVYDMGPLGVELQNAIKRLWWREMVDTRPNIVGLDAQILMHPKVWDASGHTEAFTDPLVDCGACKKRFRADHLYEDATDKNADDMDMEQLGAALKEAGVKCPNCGKDAMGEPRTFNLLVGAEMGVIEGEKETVWLRGETAQGIYVNALRTAEAMRLQPPFGIAQIGKAFRNEITPRNFLFRVREFEQMEMQFFVRDEKMADEQYAFWRERRMQWLREVIGLSEENTRYHEHSPEERAHYATAAEDVQFQFPFGWKELEGIHNRGDWDLSRHSEYSGNKQTFFDQEANEHYIPRIVETSGGVGRLTLAVMSEALDEETL
ncbi:MAG: glycine--tRNA ligase, partial [Candidatus Andersenbacteria bacterium]|nr:glycine--tRNA ligase [Candidatus Andersenbacteria bacterium]